MARIGMIYPVYAPITAETAGSAITYGTGGVVAHAIAATLTQNRRDNPLYADDIKVENDKGMTDYSIEFEGDYVSPAVRVALLGDVKEGSTGSETYSVNDINAPYVGFGYIRKLMVNNVTKYQATWFHKVQFAATNLDDNTKADSISWGTDKLTGTGFGVTTDSSGAVRFYEYMECTTESAAKTWLNGKANIT